MPDDVVAVATPLGARNSMPAMAAELDDDEEERLDDFDVALLPELDPDDVKDDDEEETLDELRLRLPAVRALRLCGRSCCCCMN